MRDHRSVVLRPVVSEKSYRLIERNVYTFVVASDAAKPEIRTAVEALFGVSVLNVNTMNRKGKRQRNRRSNTWSRRPGTKRAFVTLSAGDSIDLFEV